ncbi:MAG: hypothetical protein VKM34_00475 [Cyanobacteriota bacterium]|nr:hypothetical protein [Cyanobacteriota bacterium]
MLSCLVASIAAPAGGTGGHDALAELRELLAPGFGPEPEILIGIGGLGLRNPVTGTVVPPFSSAPALVPAPAPPARAPGPTPSSTVSSCHRATSWRVPVRFPAAAASA